MKFLFALLAILVMGAQAEAQYRLKITNVREIKYDQTSQKWDEWPTTKESYTEGSEPILVMTSHDEQGAQYSISITTHGKESSFDVTYTGYDAKNKWYKYNDVSGNQVFILGTTMSRLARHGWPSTHVQIYVYVYTKNYALLLE